jgi:hypothetical protein
MPYTTAAVTGTNLTNGGYAHATKPSPIMCGTAAGPRTHAGAAMSSAPVTAAHNHRNVVSTTTRPNMAHNPLRVTGYDPGCQHVTFRCRAVAGLWLPGRAWSFQDPSVFATASGSAFSHLLVLELDGQAVSMAAVSWAAPHFAGAATPLGWPPWSPSARAPPATG